MQRLPVTTLCFLLGILGGIAPLWAGARLPLVDLPQHLHLISVLHRLDDPTTLYPEVFAARGQLTPYLGYYYAVSTLNWLVPLEVANRLFLSLYVAAFPLAFAFLLRTFRRPVWPALLTLPLAYGDNFAWGFINFVAAIPLAVFCAGCFVRSVQEPARRRLYALATGASLVAVLLFHVQLFAFLGVALPLLLLTTRAPDDGASLQERFRRRVPVLLGVLPGVILFLLWIGLRLGAPQEIEAGVPWKAWGPLLSPQNLAWKTPAQNRDEFLPLLANQLHGGKDSNALKATGIVAALGLLLWLYERARRVPVLPGATGAARLWALAAVALAGYFLLPFDIRGYMYYLNSRYAQLAAPLLLVALPVVANERLRQLLAALSVGAVLIFAVPLHQGYAAFNAEAAGLDALIAASAQKARVAGLPFDASSGVVTHPVYLHAGTEIARARGGYNNFSFALTPHSPLKYRNAPPPWQGNEWRADLFNFATMGPAYDHFLVRGPSPERLQNFLPQSELFIAARAGPWTLFRRR